MIMHDSTVAVRLHPFMPPPPPFSFPQANDLAQTMVGLLPERGIKLSFYQRKQVIKNNIATIT